MPFRGDERRLLGAGRQMHDDMAERPGHLDLGRIHRVGVVCTLVDGHERDVVVRHAGGGGPSHGAPIRYRRS